MCFVFYVTETVLFCGPTCALSASISLSCLVLPSTNPALNLSCPAMICPVPCWLRTRLYVNDVMKHFAFSEKEAVSCCMELFSSMEKEDKH